MISNRKKSGIIILVISTMLSFTIKKVDALTSDTNRNFKRITIEDGLSQGSISSIIQDQKGYMWIGTNDGLNKYNGSRFEVYKYGERRENYISGNDIKDIAEDNDGNIWVGTTTGLNKIDTTTNKVTTYLPNENGCNISNYLIRAIMVSKEGEVLVGTDDGLNIYNKETDNFERVYSSEDKNNSLSDQEIYCIEEDSNGDYWIGTKNGLNKIDKDKKIITKYFEDDNKNSISSNDISSLRADDSGYLWVGTYYGGLSRLNIKNDTVECFNINDESDLPGALIRDILIDSTGELWIATDSGFAKFKEKEKRFITYNASKYNTGSLMSNDIYCIYEDKSGAIWIGTRYGINLFNPQNLFNYYKSDPFDDNSLSADSISGIYEDEDGVLWIGTFNDGLNVFDRKNNIVTRINNKKYKNEDINISSNLVREITGIDNEIWIATENGLNKFDKTTGKITKYNEKDGLMCSDIRTLLIDKDGILWIGTRDGLFTFDRKNKVTDYSNILKKAGIKDLKFMDIYEDEDGLIWMAPGIEDGLVSLDKTSNEVKQYNNFKKSKDGSDRNYCIIISINKDEKGNLWLGTSTGLIKFNEKTEEYVLYTEDNGLSNNFIYGILIEDENHIWMSTNYGISKFNINEERFINFNNTDGIQGNEFNGHSYFKSESGEMFFGGTNGLTSFMPKDIVEKTFATSVEIESIHTNYGKIKLENNIDLDYKNTQLRFDFFTPDYRDSKKIQYAYKLIGLDSEWTISEEVKSVSYTNLNPGKYEFKISARNSSGEWAEPTTININLEKPPCKTNFAYGIYFLLISTVIYLIWNRVKILDSLVKQRTIELNKKLKENEDLYSKLLKHEKYKNNYFINLSHELRTPLNIISATQSLIDTLNQQNKNISKDKMSYYMNTIKRNCSRLVNLIDNILDTSKIETGSYRLNIKEQDIVFLVEEVALSMKELTEREEINLIIEPYIEEKLVEFDALEIERVIINLISNAIKFTPIGGTIQVYIWDLGDNIKISVKDNGIGIDSKNHKSIFDRFSQAYADTSEEYGGSGLGLTLSRQLIELHNGDIWVESELGSGSEFIIILPTKYDK